MEGAKKRIPTPPPTDLDGLPGIFDPESFEWKAMSTLLPVLKVVHEEAEAPGEHELLDDWIVVSECATCLIKFLSRCDLIEECDKVPSRIDRLKEACQGSSFDYTALIRYVEGIYADAADLREKNYKALKDDEEETVEDLRAQSETQFADLALTKYRRQLMEVAIFRAREQGGRLAITLERSIGQVDELKRQVGVDEQMQQTRQAELNNLRRKEAEAEKHLDETQGKVSDIPLGAYQEQSRLVLWRAKMLSLLEPGTTPLSLASESARTWLPGLKMVPGQPKVVRRPKVTGEDPGSRRARTNSPLTR